MGKVKAGVRYLAVVQGVRGISPGPLALPEALHVFRVPRASPSKAGFCWTEARASKFSP